MASPIQSFSVSHNGRAMVGPEALRRARDVGFEQPLEFDQRLLVKAHVIDPIDADAALAQAVVDGATGNRASCFFRVNRSSWAAATISPSTTRHAAES
jgi:hypothetical protein